MAHGIIEGGSGSSIATVPGINPVSPRQQAAPVSEEPARGDGWLRAGRASVRLFVAGTLSGAAAILALLLLSCLPPGWRANLSWVPSWSGYLWFGVPTLLCLLGVVRAIEAGLRNLLARDPAPAPGLHGGIAVALFVGGFFTLLGAAITWLSTGHFARGRQLRKRGKLLLPELGAGGDWASLASSAAAPEALRTELARAWRENGKTEHASVAAFAKLQMELIALGAPPELLAAANRDSLDEIRHAELCFSLARALDGRAESPRPFPQAQRTGTLSRIRSLALCQLAVSSLVDGALHEGISARVLAKLSRRAADPAVQAVLRELAADEGRHAANGWDVVEWCLAEGGAKVSHALQGALDALDAQPGDFTSRGAEWEQHGLPGRELESSERAHALDHLRRRLARLTAGAQAA